MAQKQKLKPTVSRPIFVAAKMAKLLATPDILNLLSQKLPIRGEIPEGEISEWIRGVIEGPAGLTRPKPEQDLEIYVYLYFAGYLFNFLGIRFEPPRILDFFEELYSSDRPQLQESHRKNDLESQIVWWKDIGKRVGVRVVVDGNALVCNLRALQTIVACWLVHKTDPISLMAQAGKGDRRAVLDLIKVDKLFLHDSCTYNVIKKSELEYDRHFLRQVDRAAQYEPKIGTKAAHRLYLYTLFGLSVARSNLKKIQDQLDPKDKVFPGDFAFEKFVDASTNSRNCARLTD